MKGVMIVLLLGAIAMCAAHDAGAAGNRKMLGFGGEVAFGYHAASAPFAQVSWAVQQCVDDDDDERSATQCPAWSLVSLQCMRTLCLTFMHMPLSFFRRHICICGCVCLYEVLLR